MDTIDIKLKLKKELNEIKLEQIKKQRWISRFRCSGINDYSFVISFPKFFYAECNAYLVRKQEEVDLVLKEVTSIFKEYVIEEAQVKRIDYPFTFIMPKERTFTSYFELFKLVGLIKEKDFKSNNYKYYSNLATGENETIIFTNTKNTNNYTKKVLLYNQALKLRETKANAYAETLEKFPNLKRRMRIEVSLKMKQDILYNGILKIDLDRVKRDSFSYFAKHTFNINRINEEIKDQVFNLTAYLQDVYYKKINWNQVMAEKLNDPKTVFSKEIFNGAIKDLNKSDRGKENARRVIRQICINTRLSYQSILKDIADIISSIGEEAKE